MEVIELYKENTFLWDVQNEKYKSKRIKDDLLKRFSINSLKNTFTGNFFFFFRLS